jgi:hypothetical protein
LQGDTIISENISSPFSGEVRFSVVLPPHRDSLYKILSSYGSEDIQVGLLGYNAMWTCKQIPAFQMPPSLGLKLVFGKSDCA